MRIDYVKFMAVMVFGLILTIIYLKIKGVW